MEDEKKLKLILRTKIDIYIFSIQTGVISDQISDRDSVQSTQTKLKTQPGKAARPNRFTVMVLYHLK